MRSQTTRALGYLRAHAEPSGGWACGVRGRWRKALVVPLHDEALSFWQSIAPALARERVLVIAVVNETAQAASAVRVANAQLLAALQHEGGSRLAPGALQCRYAGQDLVVIDASTPGFELPAGQGVGLARKLGLDLACALWVRGAVETPWLHTTDADATLAEDYFSGSDAVAPGVVALTYPFWHTPGADAAVDRATALYEVWMRYYTAGLASAGSPFAINTLGSTIAVHADAYAAVRGVPKRQAGEDFHLLAKLAKLGAIEIPQVADIKLRSRLSDRVPFGTGPGVASMCARLEQGLEPRLYDPRAFVALGALVAMLGKIATGGPVPDPEMLASPAAEAWRDLGGATKLTQALRGARDVETRAGRVTQWFDALRTLRFVHALHRHGYQECVWSDALEALGGVHAQRFDDRDPTLTALRRGLAAAAPKRAGVLWR